LRTISNGKDSTHCVVFSPSDGLLVAGGGDQVLRIWDPGTGALARELPCQGTIVNLVFNREGTRLAAAGAQGGIKLYDWASGTELQTFQGYSWCWDMGLAFGPGAARLFSGGERTIKMWDPATGLEVFALPENDRVVDLALSPDGGSLAVLTDKEV